MLFSARRIVIAVSLAAMLLNIPGCYRPPQGDTLHKAVWEGREREVEWFLDHGADVNAYDKETGCTALHLAALNDREDLIERLLARSANIQAKTQGLPSDTGVASSGGMGPLREETPLHIAASRGHFPAVKLLVDRGADLNARDSYGRTPLHTAAATPSFQVVALLVDKKADIQAKDKQGYTPLQIASAAKISWEVVHVLRGASLKTK
jgi:ankyrin repeat protein